MPDEHTFAKGSDMRGWDFWGWVAYACLLVGAVIIAADTGLKLSPSLEPRLPDIFHSPYWGFAPLVLLVAATIILVRKKFGDRSGSPQPDSFLNALSDSKKADRVFVGDNVTPKYLSDLFRERTTLQADALVKPFIGKWMTLTGKVANVSSKHGGHSITLNGSYPAVFLYFDEKWSERIAIIQLGDKIRAVGKIDSVWALGVTLESCELIDQADLIR